MKFIDEATLLVQGGKGGDGSRSFRREKFVPFGGPDGGDGGKGGSVYLLASDSINTLVDFRHIRRAQGTNGENGLGAQCTGKQGLDKVVNVPVGTTVKDLDTGEILGDLTSAGTQLLVARGGSRGLGNVNFKSSTNRAPRFATNGKPGEVRNLHLELKLLADVGLLGLPNAGKSTLIRAVSKARPKVADYPFTTLIPQLGSVRISAERHFVMADFPGIIEGARMGAGLGLQFLKHLTRAQLLLHVVDLTSEDPIADIKTILHEIGEFSSDLLSKTRWLVLNKTEHMSPDETQEWVERIREECQIEGPVYVISGLAKKGVDKLCQDCMLFLEANRPPIVESEDPTIDENDWEAN